MERYQAAIAKHQQQGYVPNKPPGKLPGVVSSRVQGGFANKQQQQQQQLQADQEPKELPKVADVEKESLYGYVFGVSGPGKQALSPSLLV